MFSLKSNCYFMVISFVFFFFYNTNFYYFQNKGYDLSCATCGTSMSGQSSGAVGSYRCTDTNHVPCDDATNDINDRNENQDVFADEVSRKSRQCWSNEVHYRIYA